MLMAWLVCLCAPMPAELALQLGDSGYTLRAWGREEGLPENSATAVAQTRDGYLWLGTWNGLVRFNGERFTVFDPRNTPQLPNEAIVNLHVDRRDRLSPRRFLTVNHDSPVPRQLTRAVAPAHQGGVWLAVYDAGLFHSDSSETKRIPVPGPDNASAYGLTVLEDRSGRLWYGDQDACWLRSGQSGFERVPLHPATDANVNALFQDSRDRIWIATREGPVVYEEDQFRQLGPEAGVPRGVISGLGEDFSGATWLAASQGVYRQEGDGFQAVLGPNGHPIRDVLCLKTDADGALWMRTRAEGLIGSRDGQVDRVGLELHDDFSQSLALLSVEMELFGSSTPKVQPDAAQRLGGMAARVKELSSEVHRMAHQLHPAKLDQLGLVAAARGFCR